MVLSDIKQRFTMFLFAMVHVEDVTVNNKLDTGLFWIHLDIHKTIFIVSQIIRRISCE